MSNHHELMPPLLAYHPVGGGKKSPLLKGLISYWKLDETNGTRSDSRSNRTMSIQGSVGYDVGIMGNCVTFVTGAANYLTTASDALLKNYNWSLGFTVAGWMYIPTAVDGRATLLSKYSAGNTDWYLWLESSTSFSFAIYDSVSGGVSKGSNEAISVDTWYFLTGRYNPTTKKAELLINAVSKGASDALPNVPKNSYSALAINRTGSTYGTCRIDGVGLWSRYLSDAEVSQLYNSGAGLEYPFLGNAPIEATEWYDGNTWYIAP